MTTSVKVTAHCSGEKQVRISRSDSGVVGSSVVIQDGETNEQVVYEGWSISVQEEVKPA